MIVKLDKDLWFPNPRNGEPDGCFAAGGDLSIDRLLLAYSNGIFPWYDFKESPYILWYCPMDRFVIFPKEIHVSHSMRTLMNKNLYTITFNRAFEQVINECSRLRINQRGAWLGKDMIEAALQLHDIGFAMSVEVWQDERLVGGLYGITIGYCFFGESMFSLVPSASKLALIHLARHLQAYEHALIDCQFETPHLKSMGGRHIPYDEYMKIISHI